MNSHDIDTDTEIIEAMASDAELSDQVVDKILDRIAGRPDNAPMPLGARTPWRPEARLSTVQPEGHALYGPECQAAWAGYMDVVRVWVDARDVVASVASEQQDERAEASRVLRQQERDGKPLKAPKPLDWSSEFATREARRDIAFERGESARKAYDELVRANAGRWVAELVAAVQPARKEAVKALAALAAVDKWLRVRDAAIELSTMADPSLSDYAVMTRDDAAVLRAGRAALPALRALLASEHPLITGSFLTTATSEKVQPPLYVRQAMAESENGAPILAAIEVAEGLEVSRYASGWHHLVTPGEKVQWRRPRS